MQITWWITLIVLIDSMIKRKYYLLISQFILGALSTDISLRGLLLHSSVYNSELIYNSPEANIDIRKTPLFSSIYYLFNTN